MGAKIEPSAARTRENDVAGKSVRSAFLQGKENLRPEIERAREGLWISCRWSGARVPRLIRPPTRLPLSCY